MTNAELEAKLDQVYLAIHELSLRLTELEAEQEALAGELGDAVERANLDPHAFFRRLKTRKSKALRRLLRRPRKP